jgi:hypothetical protein
MSPEPRAGAGEANMKRHVDAENLFYLGTGPLAAIGLGIVLIPMRELTVASNLAFAFLTLTLVIAELGGAWAALATALASTLSLDFFLTQPYLRLTIEGKHDIIAFFGLGACGLVVATLASLRRRRIAALAASHGYHDLLRSTLSGLDATARVGPQVERMLRAALGTLPLAAAAVRDERGRLVASTAAADEPPGAPATILEPEAPRPRAGLDALRSPVDPPLPGAGARIALGAGRHALGWLEVWGDGRPASADARRALADLARLVALLLLAGAGVRGAPPESP